MDVYLHGPGMCPERYYGRNCDGKATLMEDPYQSEIHNNHTLVWLCEGIAEGCRMDI